MHGFLHALEDSIGCVRNQALKGLLLCISITSNVTNSEERQIMLGRCQFIHAMTYYFLTSLRRELLSLPSGSSVDATNLYNQKLMAEYVKNQALDGWISRQDRSDDRLEVYIYNHIDSVIVRECIIYGP